MIDFLHLPIHRFYCPAVRLPAKLEFQVALDVRCSSSVAQLTLGKAVRGGKMIAGAVAAILVVICAAVYTRRRIPGCE